MSGPCIGKVDMTEPVIAYREQVMGRKTILPWGDIQTTSRGKWRRKYRAYLEAGGEAVE